jgi:hypothetical protein
LAAKTSVKQITGKELNLSMPEFLTTKFFQIIDINSAMSSESSTINDMNMQVQVTFDSVPSNINILVYIITSRMILGGEQVRLEN